MTQVVGLVLLAVAALVQSVASQDQHQGGSCVTVPSMCHNLIDKNYTHMRLPNMLNHTRKKDVAADLNLWSRLFVSKKCNAGNQLKYFLCFTYAPVCVDSNSMNKLIPPCKSMCQNVRDSCEPVMRKHNYSWPEVFDCDQNHRFLDDASQMCISLKILNLMKAAHSDKCSCRKVYKESRLTSLFCRSHLVIRGRLISKSALKPGSDTVYKIKVTPTRILRATKYKMADPVRGVHKTLSLTVFNDKQNCRCGKLKVRKRTSVNGQFFVIARIQRRELQVDAIGKWRDIPNTLKKTKC